MRTFTSFLIFLAIVAPFVHALDISVQGVSVNAPELIAKNTYALNILLHNDSNEQTGTTLTVTDNGTQFFSLMYVISQGADLNAIVQWTPSADGNHQILASIDSNDDDLSNNSINSSFQVKKGIDLTVQAIFLQQSVLPGQQLEAQIAVANIGDKIAGFSGVNVYIDDTLVKAQQLAPLVEGQVYQVKYNFTAQLDGTHSLRAVIDENNFIMEFDENNNSNALNYSVFNSLDGNGDFNFQNFTGLSRNDVESIMDQKLQQFKSNIQADLDTCRTERAQYKATLDATVNELSSANSELSTTKNSLTANQASLSGCQATLSTQQATLASDYQQRLSLAAENDKNKFEEMVKAKDDTISSKTSQMLFSWVVVVLFALFFLGSHIMEQRRKGILALGKS